MEYLLPNDLTIFATLGSYTTGLDLIMTISTKCLFHPSLVLSFPSNPPNETQSNTKMFYCIDWSRFVYLTLPF